ncbi:uncharacterized protein LOC131939400 isoform X2 [Physella acuta]|uniref:uncharacterized protein LOC131939400 isoform X2 n=1 Tax=Physella acuta TaxID=109671 RepID=UPI0027DC4D83|nr:uncharacterized protein LOC131939400 isoform X2 [Physella acuta]
MNRAQIILLYFYLLTVAVLYACSPAEEGQPYELKHTMSKAPSDTTMVMWTKDDILVAECPVDAGDCVTNDINWLTAKVELVNNTIVFSLRVNYVTRKLSSSSKGLWKLRTHTSSLSVEVFYYCTLQVYAKPRDIFCEYMWSIEGYNVDCKVKNIFPEAMMIVERRNVPSPPISCINSKEKEEPAYYNSSCKTTFLREDLHLQTEYFTFFVYPNLVASKTNYKLGLNTSSSLNIEPKTVVLKECEVKQQQIKCRCRRLDGNTSIFDWYMNNTRVGEQSDEYITSVTELTDQAVACLPVVCSENDCAKISTQTSACDYESTVIVLSIFLTIAIIVICVICLILIKRCKPEKGVPGIDRMFYRAKYSTNKDEAESNEKNPDPQAGTDDIKMNVLNEKKALLHHEVSTLVTIDSDSHKARKIFDLSIYKVKSSILLIGTRNCNIELFKRSILQRKNYVTNENKDSLKRNPQKGDSAVLTLNYSERDNRIIKLVDGPVYGDIQLDYFIDHMKSCLCLSHMGYNAIFLAFTADTVREMNLLLTIVHDDFNIDMNYAFCIMIYSKECVIEKEVESEYINIKNITGERFLMYDINDPENGFDEFFARVEKIQDTCTSHLMANIDARLFKNNIELEEILKETCLFMGKLHHQLHENINTMENIEYRLQRIEELWNKLQKEIDNTYIGFDAAGSVLSKTQEMQMDKRIIEDITQLIECLRYIYFVPQPMKRSKQILLPDLENSYQSFHDWYVESVTMNKDDLLDKNLKIRLSNVNKHYEIPIDTTGHC